MIKVYGFPKTRSLRILWTLEEIGADYGLVKVDLFKGEAEEPAFLQLNPAGKVPVLVDDDLVLSESGAICTYLADKYPETGLAPEPRTGQRAIYNQMCFFALTELEQPLWTMAKHHFVLPAQLRVPDIINAANWEFARAVDALAMRIGEQEFVLGSRFTVADVLVGNVLSWARNSDMPIEADLVNTYADRVLGRPALARAREMEHAFGP